MLRDIEASEEGWGENSVRCAVLSLLKHHSQSALAKLSPLSQSTLSAIANGRYKNRLSLEKCREFGLWYATYLQETDYSMLICSMAPPDSRMTFHPDHELPLLRSWYREHPCPSNDQFIIFAHELNQGHVRQDRPKVVPQKIKIWWKNERQREKRSQAVIASGISATAASSSSLSTTSTAQEDQELAGGHSRRSSGLRAARKRSRSASQGSRPSRGEGCGDEVRRDAEEEEEDTVLVVEPESVVDAGVQAGSSTSATPDWASPKTDRGSRSSCSTTGASEEVSNFLTSLTPLPPAPDRRAALKPGRKSLLPETFTSMAQGQGHMLSPGPPPPPHSSSSTAWQSSFLAWSSQRRSPELREVTAMSPTPDPGLLLPWQHHHHHHHHHPHHRLPVFPPQQQRAGGASSRSESEREGTPTPVPHGAFGSVERYRYSHSHDLTFTPSSTTSTSTSMDFTNIL
ncbi:hypothetical protein ACOMHN_005637 [Nucella lapillus]